MPISLETKETKSSKDEKAQLAQVISEVEIIKDQMTKVAAVLTQLSQASLEQQRKQPGISEHQLAEIGHSLQAMKVHVDSFPHALREARRSDVSTQKVVEELSERVNAVESRLVADSTSRELSAAKG
jgi:KaiC/GvpD/RAD55 family RecA-like ATPase